MPQKRVVPKDHMPKLGAPKRPNPVTRYSVKDLARLTQQDVKKRMRQLALKSLRVAHPPKTKLLAPDTLVYVMIIKNKENKDEHKVTLFFEGGKYRPSAKVIVDCDCPDHIFRWEYALAHKAGNSFIWRSNNDFPIDKNPRLTISLCKHSYAALKFVHRRGRSGNLPKRGPNSRSVKVKLRTG